MKFIINYNMQRALGTQSGQTGSRSRGPHPGNGGFPGCTTTPGRFLPGDESGADPWAPD